MKRYFPDFDDNFCYPLDEIKTQMKFRRVTECKAYVAKREIGSACFYCKIIRDTSDRNTGGCNLLQCKDYLPRNGKKGICKHWGYCYEPTDEFITIKI